MHPDARLADAIVALCAPRARDAAEGARKDLACPTLMINSAYHGIGVRLLGDGAAIVFMDRIARHAGPENYVQ